MYSSFVEAVDAIDNGIESTPKGVEALYKDTSCLSARVGRMNKRWNEVSAETDDQRFERASDMAGREFEDVLRGIVESEVPARALVEEAIRGRMEVHGSGEIIKFPSGGMPWKGHLYDLEGEMNIEGVIKFVLYTDTAGMWRVQAVTVKGTAFTNRVSLPAEWRGMRDAELIKVSGIEGGKFVHAGGFIGGSETYKGGKAMAVKAIGK